MYFGSIYGYKPVIFRDGFWKANEKKKISRKFNNQYPTRNIQYSMKKIDKKSFGKNGKTKTAMKIYNKSMDWMG